MASALGPLFIFDWATCNNYFTWFFESGKNDNVKRENLTDLHLVSAMEKANSDNPLIIITDNTAEKIVAEYGDRLAVGTFLDAVDIETMPPMMPVNALVKLMMYHSLAKKEVYLVISDRYIYDLLKEAKIPNVIDLEELGTILKKHKFK